MSNVRMLLSFQSPVAVFAILICFSVGCSDSSVTSPSDSTQLSSLAPGGEAVQSSTSEPEEDALTSSADQAGDPERGAEDSSQTTPEPVSDTSPASSDQGDASEDLKPQSDSPAQQSAEVPATDSTDAAEVGAAPKKSPGTKLPDDLLEGSKLTPLNPKETVLLDLAGKRILLKSRVCLTEGLLEMLLCPHQTKEHESILSTQAQAYTVHTGLLALGCKEGTAARYDPDTEKYIPASGQVIDIFLHWIDTDGKLHRERAQNWVRRSRQRYYQAKFETLPADLELEPDGNLRYDDVNKYLFWYGPMAEQERDECLKMSTDKKFQEAIREFHKDGQEHPMTAEWVFVGSGFYEDGDSAKQYLAEGGYMICVANFPMAMIDVATVSDSNGTESLFYEATTERIPPRDSEVLIELVPRPVKKDIQDKAAATPEKTKQESAPTNDSDSKGTFPSRLLPQ